MNIAVVIPCWNIRIRGFDRLRNLLISLENQSLKPAEIIVVDGSENEIEYLGVQLAAMDGHSYTISFPQKEFNKPKLINWAAKQTNSDYLIFTDCDYIFSPELLLEASKIATPEKLIYKGIRTLTKSETEKIQPQDIFLNLSEGKPNLWPAEVACGAFQLHHRSFFDYSGGLNEKMSGMGGMDEEYLKRAKMHGLECIELKEGTILHQWHQPAKNKTPRDMEKNWNLLHNCNSVIQNK